MTLIGVLVVIFIIIYFSISKKKPKDIKPPSITNVDDFFTHCCSNSKCTGKCYRNDNSTLKRCPPPNEPKYKYGCNL
jgi:hypothetical protein